MTLQLAVTAAALAAGAALLVISVRRPALGAGLLMLGVPLTAGLQRGAAIPLLRPSEAIGFVVLFGALVHQLPLRRERDVAWLEIVVAVFAAVSVMVPALLLLLTHAGADVNTWRTVLAPLQFAAIFLLFSRVDFSPSELRWALNLALLASVVVAAVALLELLGPAGLRGLVESYYPPAAAPPGDATFRPDSLVGHYSTVGGLLLLNVVLALALLANRAAGFSPWWLTLVVLVDGAGMLASQTFAPVLALPLAAGAVVAHLRRLPRHWWVVLGGLPVAAVLLWPVVSRRIAEQGLLTGGQLSLILPTSMQVRMRYWNEFMLPALQNNLWFGSGTVIPSTVPAKLVKFVDNEYLWAGFRAGIAGVAAVVMLLAAVGAGGWTLRRARDPVTQAVGAAALAGAIGIAVMGMTAEYITFGGVTQDFAMLAGLVAGAQAVRRSRRVAFSGAGFSGRSPELRVVDSVYTPRLPAYRSTIVPHRVAILLPEATLIRDSMVVFAGLVTARLLGFGFSIATARLLLPADFGWLAFALALVGVASPLLAGAPIGLSTFLARESEHPHSQVIWLSNWLAVVLVILVLSAGICSVAIAVTGLGGWLAVGLVANLIGVATLETYREALRGVGRYTAMTAFYALANLIQLVTVLALGAAGFRSAGAFLMVYGLSSVAALLVMQAIAPLPVGLSGFAVMIARIRPIVARFVGPLLLQSAFYAVWLSGDLILVRLLLGPSETGQYGAAKTLANVMLLVPLAVQTTVAPQVARMAGQPLRYVLGALLLTCALTAPAGFALGTFAHPVTVLLFGPGYAGAAAPEPLLALGMGFYALSVVLVAGWTGLGRPAIAAFATGFGMVVTMGSGVPLVELAGLPGAAAAFAAGSAARLAVLLGFTAWNVRRGSFRHAPLAVPRSPAA